MKFATFSTNQGGEKTLTGGVYATGTETQISG